MPQIFISYRRNDTAYLAANLNDKLQQHFGEGNVFFDVDNIPLGVDFREYIGNAIGKCDVLLAIIGDQWMGIDSQGKRRIDDPHDHMRVEIESALKRKVPVIPVLVEKATMPSPADLPPALESLAFHNAAEIRPGRDLRQHIEQLIRGLEALFNSNVVPPPVVPNEEPNATGRADERRNPPPGIPGQKPVETTGSASPASTEIRPELSSSDSAGLLEEIQKALNEYVDSHIYLGKAIPPGKLANAISAYAPRVSPPDVLFLYDNTIWGGAKDGMLLTSDAVYWRNMADKSGQIYFAEINSVEFSETKSYFVNAKVLINQEEIEVNMADTIPKAPALTDKNLLAERLAGVIRGLSQCVKR